MKLVLKIKNKSNSSPKNKLELMVKNWDFFKAKIIFSLNEDFHI